LIVINESFEIAWETWTVKHLLKMLQADKGYNTDDGYKKKGVIKQRRGWQFSKEREYEDEGEIMKQAIVYILLFPNFFFY
jgi:hypothetical protein